MLGPPYEIIGRLLLFASGQAGLNTDNVEGKRKNAVNDQAYLGYTNIRYINNRIYCGISLGISQYIYNGYIYIYIYIYHIYNIIYTIHIYLYIDIMG